MRALEFISRRPNFASAHHFIHLDLQIDLRRFGCEDDSIGQCRVPSEKYSICAQHMALGRASALSSALWRMRSQFAQLGRHRTPLCLPIQPIFVREMWVAPALGSPCALQMP